MSAAAAVAMMFIMIVMVRIMIWPMILHWQVVTPCGAGAPDQ